ncbi:efflux RND transporter permease subunit, partial [Campylobacter jejuni]
VTVRKTSSATLAGISMYSSDGSMSAVDVYNYIALNVLDELKRVPGVGDANAIGNRNYSLRIWLKPDLLNKFGATAT